MFDILYTLALILVLIGGINWGLVGLRNFDLLKHLNKTYFKNDVLLRFIYILVGISAIYISLFIIQNKLMSNYINLKKYNFNYQNQEHHWCIDGKEGDASCKLAKYGNKCLNNTCVFI